MSVDDAPDSGQNDAVVLARFSSVADNVAANPGITQRMISHHSERGTALGAIL